MEYIKIKPLSVNQVWAGRRFKTVAYKDYEKSLSYLLPKELPLIIGKLKLDICFGLSSKSGDIDNPVKPFIDILQKKYNFNDKNIYELLVKKQDVKKGEEFIKFEFKTI